MDDSLKHELETNAKNIMKIDLDESMTEMNSVGSEFNENLQEALVEGENARLTVFDTSGVEKDEFNGLRDGLKKESYHFPDVLNIGSLVSLQDTPSDIYSKNKFIHEIPFIIPVEKSGVAFLVNNKHKDAILGELESIVVNMVSSLPDGLVKMTLIDKTGSGQNFSALNLFNEKFVTGRVLAEDSEIEEELTTIKNSMGNISQAITANGFASVEDYNNNTDEIPQRYNFIVINDFPSGFNKKSTENLFALIESGYKSGIYVFMTSKFDTISGFNQDINGLTLNSFLSLMNTFQYSDRTHIYLKDKLIKQNIEMVRSPIINEEKFKSMVNSSFKIKLRGEKYSTLETKIKSLNSAIENVSLKPMIAFERLIPNKSEWYSKEASRGISVPFGKVGIENSYLDLGVNKYDEVENVHHGIICGMTGSGKTVLIHDMILMSCFYYSPEELQFHLLDYKEGTEFALYKDFPQVNILSMDSEVEFGHDVLKNGIDEITRRGKLFKKHAVANLKGYNNVVPDEDKLPRIVIIIDEFQNLFPKDPKVATKSNELFDDILRRGRSFGVNLLVATQTLIGVDLERQILSNMPLRIGMKMTEKDAVKIFGENNIAPKFVTNPGEGIYNNSHGLSKNNVAFQAAFLEDEDVNALITVLNKHMDENLSERAKAKLEASRFVYMGDREGSLKNLVERKEDTLYIGEPVGLKKSHETIELNRDFGENIMMLGGDQLKAISILINLSKQLNDFKIYFGNFSLSLNDFYKKAFKDNKNVSIFGNDISNDIVKKVHLEFKDRLNQKDRTKESILLALTQVESSKILNESGNTPDKKKLDELILSGAEYGIHVLIYALDHATLRDQDLTKSLNKFKKKIVFEGGGSEKILNNSVKASKSKKVSVYEFGNDLPVKFKPYILPEVKEIFPSEVEEDE